MNIHEIQSLHQFTKTVQQDDIAGRITACLDRLKQGTDHHHVRQAFLALPTSFEHLELEGNY